MSHMTYHFKESRSKQKIISNLNFLMPVMVYTSSCYITKHAKKKKKSVVLKRRKLEKSMEERMGKTGPTMAMPTEL